MEFATALVELLTVGIAALMAVSAFCKKNVRTYMIRDAQAFDQSEGSV